MSPVMQEAVARAKETPGKPVACLVVVHGVPVVRYVWTTAWGQVRSGRRTTGKHPKMFDVRTEVEA